MSEQTWMDGEIDRSEWGAGPWDGEPDKVQWVDEATGLDCLAVRNSLGNWCGYVGVPESHPLHGVGYNESTDVLAAALERRKEEPLGDTMPAMMAAMFGKAEPTPDLVFHVHGGLTFSDECDEPTREQYQRTQAHATDPDLIAEAKKHPRGDAARKLGRCRAACEQSFEEWVAYEMGRRICHVPREGVGEVWWFGFDCAHAGDQAPGMDATSRRLGIDLRRGDTYRTLGYVKRECAHLAAQLAAVR